MKVMHIIIGLEKGGAELMLKRLVESHSDLEAIEHLVVSLTDRGVIGRELEAAGVSVYSLGLKSIVNTAGVFLSLVRLMKEHQPDIVHTWMYHSDLLGGLAAYSVGIRNIIWGIRSTDIRKGGSRSTIFIRKACALLSKYLPRVIVCAADTSRVVHEAIGYEANKMVVLPNGFESWKFGRNELHRKRIRASLGISEQSDIVISVGRYSPVKDHATFIKAAERVLSELPSVQFLLIGKHVDNKNLSLGCLIEETGFINNFHLVGHQHDISDWLSAADVFCLHSVTEGFPNVLGEAMASSLPCVTTNVGDAAYLIGNEAFVVEPSSPKALAEKLLEVLDMSSEARSSIGKIASDRIRRHFSMESISFRYLELYKSCPLRL